MLQQSLVQRMSLRVRDAAHQTVPYRAPSRSSSVFVLYRCSVRIDLPLRHSGSRRKPPILAH